MLVVRHFGQEYLDKYEVKRLIKSGDIGKAIAIAKGFRIWKSKEDMEGVRMAHEVRVNPNFYQQVRAKHRRDL